MVGSPGLGAWLWGVAGTGGGGPLRPAQVLAIKATLHVLVWSEGSGEPWGERHGTVRKDGSCSGGKEKKN